jgi:predicted amidophosphoribosyltransferase
MNDLAAESTDPAFVSLRGGTCPRCNRAKDTGHTFCAICAAAAGPAVRAALCCGAEEYAAAWGRVVGLGDGKLMEKKL